MTVHTAIQRCFPTPSGTLRLSRMFSTNGSKYQADSTSRTDATSSLVSSIDGTGTKNGVGSISRPQRSFKKYQLLYKIATSIKDSKNRAKDPINLAEADENLQRSRGIEFMQVRNWRPGDVYAPHDLSPEETKKWRMRKQRNRDVFDELNINPLDEWKNFPLLSEFMTSMGRIKHPRETGLRPVNQRRIAKAIRRAVGMGFHPSVHYHPELLRRKGPWQFR